MHACCLLLTWCQANRLGLRSQENCAFQSHLFVRLGRGKLKERLLLYSLIKLGFTLLAPVHT